MEVRITKYDPTLRNAKGAYTNDDWTSVSDVGRFDGLTSQKYLDSEAGYLRFLFSILQNLSIFNLKIVNLETSGLECIEEKNEIKLSAAEACRKMQMTDGMIVNLSDFKILMKAAMREVVWFKAEGKDGVFVHFGYDFYLYCGSDHDFTWECIDGIFVEQHKSPYREAIAE